MEESHQAVINGVTISVVLGDITEQTTDAIVNAANPSLMGGGGVDGAIHRAGGPTILEECKKIVASKGRLPPGMAAITTGGRLRARFVIHTVGPVWRGGNHGEPEILASAYRESLRLATDYNLHSIAFPAISTGAYGYPVPQAAETALKTAVTYLRNELTSLKKIVFVLYDKDTYQTYLKVLKELSQDEAVAP